MKSLFPAKPRKQYLLTSPSLAYGPKENLKFSLEGSRSLPRLQLRLKSPSRQKVEGFRIAPVRMEQIFIKNWDTEHRVHK